MLLVRNALCPRIAKREQCYVNSLSKNKRGNRCGACRMVHNRDIYLMALQGSTWSLKRINEIYKAHRSAIKVFGINAITNGYNDRGITRKFQDKRGMWLKFKLSCGFNCKTSAGLKFLPLTFNLRTGSDRRAFETHFKASKTYIAKNEKDAKQGVRMFKANTSRSLLSQIEADERRQNVKYNIVQEMIDNPALAKYPTSSAGGFKVNMRVYLVLTCSKEKREWTMLRAGSELHYALNRYRKYSNPTSKSSFKAALDTSYWIDDLVQKGSIPHKGANRWPSSAISYLENLKKQGWTTSVEKEWKKIEGIFGKAASVYNGVVCNAQDKAILKNADRMVQLIGADILIAGNRKSGKKSLQPYLIEWNSGPAFLDYGQPKNLEHLIIAEMALLYKAGIVKKVWWLPIFQQKEYEGITADNFKQSVYKNVWSKSSSW